MAGRQAGKSIGLAIAIVPSGTIALINSTRLNAKLKYIRGSSHAAYFSSEKFCNAFSFGYGYRHSSFSPEQFHRNRVRSVPNENKLTIARRLSKFKLNLLKVCLDASARRKYVWTMTKGVRF